MRFCAYLSRIRTGISESTPAEPYAVAGSQRERVGGHWPEGLSGRLCRRTGALGESAAVWYGLLPE